MATAVRDDMAAVRWQMSEDLRARLLGHGGLRLGEWLSYGRAAVVKDAPHRAVYRVRFPDLDCHVKHYRLLGWRSWVRALLRPIKAKREYELALALSARGVPTPAPLAWGVAGSGVGPCASWLITNTIDGAESLLTFLETSLPALPSQRRTRVRQQLAMAIGAFLAKMHTAGVLHHDLHPGNLLVRLGLDDEPRLWLIDLHTVSLGPPCSWRVCASNLVVFNRYFILRASRADRLRFWNAYRAALGGAAPEAHGQMARMMECRTERSNLHFWAARDRRCLASNRYYQRVRTGSVRGHAVRDLAPAALAPLLADPDGPFTRPDAIILKDSRSSTVVEFDLPAGGTNRRVIYKRFRITERRDPWLALVRRTAALRSWVLGHGLRERCLSTARPLVVLHRVRRGLPRESYLLAEKIEGAADLHVFMDRLTIQPEPQRTVELRRRVEALARLLRQFHRRGLSHRDLKASNLLTSAAPGDHRFWFIDLVGVRRHRRLSRRRKYQNLARLHASFVRHPLLSRAEKLRFLRSYLDWGVRGKSGWKAWWRAIDAATQAKVARNARRGRPLA
jgi:tRNA A-37 threonylcarbamoyl transferase component Bud32